jgi:hypothetical protein
VGDDVVGLVRGERQVGHWWCAESGEGAQAKLCRAGVAGDLVEGGPNAGVGRILGDGMASAADLAQIVCRHADRPAGPPRQTRRPARAAKRPDLSWASLHPAAVVPSRSSRDKVKARVTSPAPRWGSGRGKGPRDGGVRPWRYVRGMGRG